MATIQKPANQVAIDPHLPDERGWSGPSTHPIGMVTQVFERINVPTNVEDKVQVKGTILDAYALLTGWRLAFADYPHEPVEMIGVSVRVDRTEKGAVKVTANNEVVTRVAAALRDKDKEPGRGMVSYMLFVTTAP